MRGLRVLARRLASMRTSAVDWLFNRRALALALRRDHVLCLGDSHAAVMDRVRVPGVWFTARPLDGTTASGVLNPQSKTGSLAIFTERLQRAKPWQQILFELGEVDCGFLIWHRSARLGIGIDEQLAATLDSYGQFLRRVAGIGFARVIVLSVPLPTIGDDPSQWGEVANMRKKVTASQAERTELTLRFNEELARRCELLGVAFVDATSGHYDPASGLIDRRFLRATHRDHHLAEAPYAELISAQLLPLWRPRVRPTPRLDGQGRTQEGSGP